MKDSLRAGIRHEHRFVVTPSQTVPALYPQADEFAAMPAVLVEVDGRRLVFSVQASDGVDVVSRGRVERVVVTRDAFDARLEAKSP